MNPVKNSLTQIPMLIFNIIVRCPRRYKHCIIASFFYITLFHQIYQNNSFFFTSSFPFFSKLKIFTLDTNKRLPKINQSVMLLWHCLPTLQMFAGFYRDFAGKSECRDFKFTGIAFIPAIPVIFEVNKKSVDFLYILFIKIFQISL